MNRSDPPFLSWKFIEGLSSFEEAILGDFAKGDGVRFSLSNHPTCYRRGRFKLLVEVASGKGHVLWGCFDEQDQPVRWFHSRFNAMSEAEAIARVLWMDRWPQGKTQ